MAQKLSSEFLLTASGIQHRVPRRTVSSYPARALDSARHRRTIPSVAALKLTAVSSTDSARSSPTRNRLTYQDAPRRMPPSYLRCECSLGSRQPHQQGPYTPPTFLRCCLGRLFLVLRPPTPEEVSPVSRQGDVASRGSSTPIRPITGRPSLAPRSLTRRPIGLPYGLLSLGEDDGLTTFRKRNPRVVEAASLRRGCVICVRGVRSLGT